MKGIRLLFAVCIASLSLGTAMSDVVQTPTRPTSRRINSTVNRPTSAPRATPRQNTTQSRTRNATLQNTRAVSSRTTRNTNLPTVNSAPAIKSRATANTRNTTVSRATTPRTSVPSRAATPQKPTYEDIISRNPQKCRDVFYSCMDEFCANKDAQLKRCACSTRINEFRGIQKNLTQVEDKLLDFSQRLLTINMDKEDAAAMNVATEGEIAFNQADKSKSKKMLDEIAKKLNTSFEDNNFTQGLNALSLSLDTESVFDPIDPNAGASTTTKSGTALYSAALPICREMALEVCTPDELSIAEGGYQMMIEQDCNTVKKSYQAQSDQARNKVFESGALLDMSRLDIHQKRNSDDILTCKNKMLNMLTDSTVCGANMEKCLDTSGQYIDPSTGTAILTPNLANLKLLIDRPSGNQTWTSIPKNSRYIAFLNTKKKFLEPAMENCQNISDYVWETFMEDALAQIKLAQDKKLELVRQSCTTLTAQCLDESLGSLTEFDPRALSIFGIQADKTSKAMCADVKNACTALFENTNTANGNSWEEGITEISTEKSYETILSTCREVGRNCIIQACTSITGNFGLCEDIDKSINRKSIINRTACWSDVLNCVASAGEKTINQIMTQQNRNENGDIYSKLYGGQFQRTNNIDTATADITTENNTNSNTIKPIYDICLKDNTCENEKSFDCQTCRLAEEIWGNCEYAPDKLLDENTTSNRIYTMTANSNNETLLSWFAHNTGTAYAHDSCRNTLCRAGYTDINGSCVDSSLITSDGKYCPGEPIIISDSEGIKITNCCPSTQIVNGKCCNGGTTIPTSDNSKNIQNLYVFKYNNDYLCSAKTNAEFPKVTNTTQINLGGTVFNLICSGNILTPTPDTNSDPAYPNGEEIKCDGRYILASTAGHVVDPHTVIDNTTTPYVRTYYYPAETTKGRCEYQCTTASCDWKHTNGTDTCAQNPASWIVDYTTSQSNP